MADFFGRNPLTIGQPIGVDDALITFNASAGRSLAVLVTGLQLQYAQQMSRAYDITTNNVHFIQGRPSGNGRFDSIAGVRRLVSGFMTQYGNICNLDDNTLHLQFRNSCRNGIGAGVDGEEERYRMTGVLINAVTMSVQGEQMVVQQQLPFEFVALIDENASSSDFTTS